MRWVYFLVVTGVAMFCGGCAAALSGLYVQTSLNAPLFIGASGFLFASSGWMVTSAISLRMKIRDITLTYLQNISARMNKSAELNRLWLREDIDHILRSEESKTSFLLKNYLSSPLFDCIREIANSYEEIGVAIAEHAVEEKMLRRSFATNLKWFWPRLEPFLAFSRNYPPIEGNPLGNESIPEIFSHCERLAMQWSGKEI